MTQHERETELTTEVERELRAFDQAIAGLPVDREFEDAAEFARELRAERPEPDEEFTEGLDARAAAGFPGGGSLVGRGLRRVLGLDGDPADSSPRHGRQVSRRLVWVGGTAVFFAAVVGVAVLQSGDDGSQTGFSDGVVTAERENAGQTKSAPESSADGGDAVAESVIGGSSADSAAPEGGGEGGPSSGTDELTPPPVGERNSGGQGNRKVQRDAQLELSTAPSEVRSVADQAIEVIESNRGIVFNSEITENEDADSIARMNVSVPTNRLQATLAELSDLAMVESRQDLSQDITANFRNAQTRLSDFQAERESLLARLANATTAQESESIRRRLRIVDREIAQARAAVQRVEQRAELATIDLTVRGDGDGTSSGGWSIGAAADNAVDILRFLASVGIVAAAVLAPLVALLLLVWLVRRRVIGRQRERALDS